MNECKKECKCKDGKEECKDGCGCHSHSGHSGGKEAFHGVKVYPGQMIKWKGKRILPNDRCPCGSGKKFKGCCGPK